MRIIGGTFKGRKFHPPADKWPTRPTTDFAKEGLFNILYNRIDFKEIKVLDLFGGTGNASYEFISRGCEAVTYVEKFVPAVKFVKKTSGELGVEDFLKVIRMDVFRFIPSISEKYDCIFADPPYALASIGKIPDLIFEHKLLLKDGLLVLEHDTKSTFDSHPNFLMKRKYGKTIFSFFE